MLTASVWSCCNRRLPSWLATSRHWGVVFALNKPMKFFSASPPYFMASTTMRSVTLTRRSSTKRPAGIPGWRNLLVLPRTTSRIVQQFGALLRSIIATARSTASRTHCTPSGTNTGSMPGNSLAISMSLAVETHQTCVKGVRMRPSIAFGIVALLASTGCRHESGVESSTREQVVQTPIASLRHDAQQAELEQGECRRLVLDEFQQAGLRSAVLLIRQNGEDRRRILVAVDSGGALRHYSDVRWARDGWAIDARLDTGANWGTVVLWRERQSGRGTAAEVLDASNLGTPRSIAGRVTALCSGELAG